MFCTASLPSGLLGAERGHDCTLGLGSHGEDSSSARLCCTSFIRARSHELDTRREGSVFQIASCQLAELLDSAFYSLEFRLQKALRGNKYGDTSYGAVFSFCW